ncbi:MAG: hypothetical protein KC656_08825 [Myxococcales bacterium]|nr:hypothetical protein [Myxococcales bacterium]
MRFFAALLAVLPLSTAVAGPGHHGHHQGPQRPAARPPAVCHAGELRVSAPRDAWFDVYVDGRKVVESRVMDGQQAVALSPGFHRVRVTDFMGRAWSTEDLDVGCGEVVVGEVYQRAGMRVVSRFSEQPVRPASYAPYGRAPRVCTAGSLSVTPFDNTWFDLYVDGAKRASARNFDGTQTVAGLAPGRHFVRVTSFVGEVWSEGYVDVRCGDAVYGEVFEDAGLRLI